MRVSYFHCCGVATIVLFGATLSSCTFLLDADRVQCTVDADCEVAGSSAVYECSDHGLCHARTPFACMGSADTVGPGTVSMTVAFYHLFFQDTVGNPDPVEDRDDIDVRLCTSGFGGVCNSIGTWQPLDRNMASAGYSTITFSGLEIGKSYFVEANEADVNLGTYDGVLTSLSIGGNPMDVGYVPGDLIPTIVQLGPIAASDEGATVLAFMFSVEHYVGAVMYGSNNPVDYTKGMALGQVKECASGDPTIAFPPEAVRIATNQTGPDVFYFLDGMPTTSAMATDESGFVGISNITGGNVVVTGTHLADPGSNNDVEWPLGMMTFTARNGWFTNFTYEPYRL